MIVDSERMVGDFLRDRPDIDAHVLTLPPEATEDSWVMITQLGASQTDVPDHLVAFFLQFDCYAGRTGGPKEANDLGRTIRAALRDLNGTQTGGVVSGVQIVEDRRLPDQTFEPARQRRILSATLWIHA